MNQVVDEADERLYDVCSLKLYANARFRNIKVKYVVSR